MANAEESQDFKENSAQGKIFQDSVHGTIRLHPLLVKIIDTPQFQRLRNIKQMGGAYFVFPGACHNRFEHSIGTAYLAGKLARILQKQKEPPIRGERRKVIRITDEDVLCVEIAGLCHDLGHGPFSHMFDGMFAKEMKKLKKWNDPKTHEEMSCEMLDFLIKDNKDVKAEFEKYLGGDWENLEENLDLEFIKDMIKPEKIISDAASWPYKGRGEEKGFLYEIISNERNKVDVDKWDYFARDCHHLGLKNSFDHERFMQCVEVRKDRSGVHQICARDEECYNLYKMFHVRFTLHQRACQHRVVSVIQRMICDAFVEEVKSETEVGKKLKGCMSNIKAYAQLDDCIFHTILHREKEGSAILKRILKRDLYPYLDTMRTNLKCGDITACIVRRDSDVQEEPDFTLAEVTFSYGMGSSNPIDDFLFFPKKEGKRGIGQETLHLRRQDVSFMLPSQYSDRDVQVFGKRDKKAEKSIKSFCEDNGISRRNRPEIIIPAETPAPSHCGD